MMNSFSIGTYLEKDEGQYLYVVMCIESSWHMYPNFKLIGVYTNRDMAIKVAKEQAKQSEECVNWLLDNDLSDCDDYEEETIYFNAVEISKEP